MAIGRIQFAVISLFFVTALAVPQHGQGSTFVTEKTVESNHVGIIKNFNDVNPDGSYTYGYESTDGTFKIESKATDGTVKGQYGFLDNGGQLKIVEYISNNQTGFNVLKESLAPPNFKLDPTSFRPRSSLPKRARPPTPQNNFIPQIHAPTPSPVHQQGPGPAVPAVPAIPARNSKPQVEIAPDHFRALLPEPIPSQEQLLNLQAAQVAQQQQREAQQRAKQLKELEQQLLRAQETAQQLQRQLEAQKKAQRELQNNFQSIPAPKPKKQPARPTPEEIAALKAQQRAQQEQLRAQELQRHQEAQSRADNEQQQQQQHPQQHSPQKRPLPSQQELLRAQQRSQQEQIEAQRRAQQQQQQDLHNQRAATAEEQRAIQYLQQQQQKISRAQQLPPQQQQQSPRTQPQQQHRAQLAPAPKPQSNDIVTPPPLQFSAAQQAFLDRQQQTVLAFKDEIKLAREQGRGEGLNIFALARQRQKQQQQQQLLGHQLQEPRLQGQITGVGPKPQAAEASPQRPRFRPQHQAPLPPKNIQHQLQVPPPAQSQVSPQAPRFQPQPRFQPHPLNPQPNFPPQGQAQPRNFVFSHQQQEQRKTLFNAAQFNPNLPIASQFNSPSKAQ